MNDPCRCGWNGKGQHPCHGKRYTCRNPGISRLYYPHSRFSLAGTQLKFSMRETFACEECWKSFQGQVFPLPTAG